MLRKSLISFILVVLAINISFLSSEEVVLADTPTPIVITVIEGITVGDGGKENSQILEEDVQILEQTSAGSHLHKESVFTSDEIHLQTKFINDSIGVVDQAKHDIDLGVTTATPQPKPTMKPTATIVPTVTKRPTATIRSRSSRSSGATTTRAPIIFSPGSKSGPAITPTPQATNKYGRAPIVTSKSSRQPVAAAPPKQPEQKSSVKSKTPTRRTFSNFFGLRSSSSKDDDNKSTASRSSSSRSRFSLVGRATGEDETNSEGQGDMAEESTGGSCASTSAREGVSVLAMLMLPLVIVNRKRLGL